MTARKSTRPPARSALVRTITLALEDMKAVNVRVMDVREVTDIADSMVIASGNSDRHVRSIADRVVERAKQAGFRPFGREGERDGEWVLVDLNDVIVHVMLPRVREFYALESLWEPPATADASASKPRSVRKPAAKKKKAAGAKPRSAAGGAAPRARKTPAKRKPRPSR
ncbi:MAG: ribosome silencing factor [Steroidobacteraceae bacterium]